MKKFGFGLLVLSMMILLIPILILGGIGPGIKLTGVINKIPFIVNNEESKKTNSTDTIKVFVKKTNKIVEMKFEDYIAGVIAAEMPVKFDVEALKAQAVTARTYAAAKMFQNGGNGCVRHPGADVCSDIHCQAWVSKADRFKSWKSSEVVSNWAKITDAVNSTKGQVISFKGSLASGVKYFSTSDGKTESSIFAFGYSAPYLVSVDSPYEEKAPNFKSSIAMSKDEFLKKIKSLDAKNTINIKNISSQIKILSWTDGGRVKQIKIGNKVFSGVDIRWAMNLKSADFNIIIDKTNVNFNVKGYGHGVGMSQWGANEMGKRGYKYDKIIKHYFTGTEILTMNAVSMNKITQK
jgi:stage II sporulation protein D